MPIFENADFPGLWRGVLLAPLTLTWIIILVRVTGLRSFSKMTSFDFVVTVATGSLLAGAAQATSWNGFIQASVAIATLFAAQVGLAYARQTVPTFAALIGNQPVLLMEDGKILEEALAATRVSRTDLIAKLREANALDPSKVKWAVLESTGDVSILHGEDADVLLLEGVRRI